MRVGSGTDRSSSLRFGAMPAASPLAWFSLTLAQEGCAAAPHCCPRYFYLMQNVQVVYCLLELEVAQVGLR